MTIQVNYDLVMIVKEQNVQKTIYPYFSILELSGNIQSELIGVHVIAAHAQE